MAQPDVQYHQTVKVKGKLPPVFQTKLNWLCDMKVYTGIRDVASFNLTSVLDEGKWLAARSGRFDPDNVNLLLYFKQI
jgi:hypothetical protein